MDVIKLKTANGRFRRLNNKIETVAVVEPTANPHLFITKSFGEYCTITHIPTTGAMPFLLTLEEARTLAEKLVGLDWAFDRRIYRDPFPHHPTLAIARKIAVEMGLLSE